MELDGSFDVPTSCEQTFEFLTSPERIANSLPDTKAFTKVDEDNFNVTSRVGIGHLRGQMKMQMRITQREPHQQAAFVGHGRGLGSTVDLEAIFELTPNDDAGTRIKWRGKGAVGGRLTSIAGGMIETVAGKNISVFIDNIRAELGPNEPESAMLTKAVAEEPPAVTAAHPGAVAPAGLPAYGSFIDGTMVLGRSVPVDLVDPYRVTPIATVEHATAELVDRAIEVARSGQIEVAALPAHVRGEILERAAQLLRERSQDLAPEVSRQTGKPLKDTRREVNRAAETLRASADAARQLFGEQPPADAMSGGDGLLSLVIRVPVGVVGAITPFNAPLNLSAHKMGPAFASGNAIVLKPAPNAPLSALSLAQILVEAGAPAASIGIVPGTAEAGARLAASPAVDMVSFTGGSRGGEQVIATAGVKRVTLELGGNSATIVHGDADLDAAVRQLVWGAFANSGQSCNSAQRIYVHRSMYEPFASSFAEAASKLVVGDPLDAASDLGTLVDEGQARRVESWIHAAIEAGGRLLVGGVRHGAALSPTVLADVPTDQRIVCDEVFGPVAVLAPYDELDEVIDRSNNTAYGLVGAVFTRSLPVALAVSRNLRVGSVMVNRPSNYRLDHLPYGGVKRSGLGREGPRYAVEEMTERRLVLIDA